jgi:hypothetical protein
MESLLLTVARTARAFARLSLPSKSRQRSGTFRGTSTPVQPCFSWNAGRYSKCGGHDGDWTRNLPVNSRALSPS